MVCAQDLELGARAPSLPKFNLLGSFSDTSLVVSILDIAISSRFCSPEGVKVDFLKRSEQN